MTSFRAVFITALVSIFLMSCGETFRPIATIITPTLPTPQNSKTAVVVTSGATNLATHYNLSGNSITGQATVGQGPVFAARAGNVGRIYVSNQVDDSLTFYTQGAPQLATTTVTLPNAPAPADPGYIETNLSLGSVYVAYEGRNSIGVISTSTNAQTAEISLVPNSGPFVMITSVDGKKLFTGNFGSNNITVIDTATNVVITTLSFGCIGPSRFAITPDGSYVYVVCKNSNNVFYINTSTLSVTDVGPVNVGSAPSFIAYDTNRKRLVVTNSGSNSVSIINEDPATPATTQHTVNATVPVGTNPGWATALADGTRVYVANQISNSVTVIDSATLAVKTTIPLAGSPQQIFSSADSLRVATTVSSPARLVSIDTTTEAVAKEFDLPGTPVSLLLIQ